MEIKIEKLPGKKVLNIIELKSFFIFNIELTRIFNYPEAIWIFYYKNKECQDINLFNLRTINLNHQNTRI